MVITFRSWSRSAHTCSHSESSSARFSTELARSFACASDIQPFPKLGSSGSRKKVFLNLSLL